MYRPSTGQSWLRSCGDIVSGGTKSIEGVALSMHSITRLALPLSDEGPDRLVHVPPGGMSGRGVLCQRWREESNQVEVKVAPSNQKDVEEVRRLPDYETATISQSHCIIEPVLRGPTGATFSPGTASIRYYVGQHDEGSKSVSRAEIEDDILDASFPVVKVDGPGRRWEADGSFTVVWQGNKLWLETELEHFCKKGLATKANTNFFKRMTNHVRRDSSRTPPSTPAPGVTPSTSGSPNISSSALEKMVTAGPLSPDFHRAGWIEVRNWTKECLGVTLAAETLPTDEAQSRAKSGNASLGLSVAGLSGGGSAEGSSSVTRQPAPFFFGLTTHWVDPGMTRPIELPGGVQSRYMWISVSKDITPEDLGVQNTEGWGLGPSSVTEDMLGSFGYSVYGGLISRMMDRLFQRKKFFQENASPATLHRTLVGIRVWEKGSISPGHFTAVLAGDLTRRCFWQAWIPSGRNFEDSLKEYLETNVVAPRR